MLDLTGKSALVTGGGRRVGRAIAIALGAERMRVAVHYHGSSSGADETCAAIGERGGEAIAVAADLRDRDETRALVDRAVSELGGLDVLVSSAASFERIELDDVDDAAWDRTMALNVSASFVLVHRAAPALRASRGSAVLVTCTSATSPYKHYLPYVVSKGAARSLMRVLALELAPDVRVNAVAPGTVLPPPDMTPEEVARLAARIPLRRIGSADDVASAVVYLSRAPFVTGHEIVVDGGRSLA